MTTARDPQTGSTDVITYEDMLDAGDILGPRSWSTGPGVFSGENFRNLEHARSVLKRYSEYYDTKHDQAVRGRQSRAAPVDHPGRA